MAGFDLVTYIVQFTYARTLAMPTPAQPAQPVTKYTTEVRSRGTTFRYDSESAAFGPTLEALQTTFRCSQKTAQALMLLVGRDIIGIERLATPKADGTLLAKDYRHYSLPE